MLKIAVSLWTRGAETRSSSKCILTERADAKTTKMRIRFIADLLHSSSCGSSPRNMIQEIPRFGLSPALYDKEEDAIPGQAKETRQRGHWVERSQSSHETGTTVHALLCGPGLGQLVGCPASASLAAGLRKQLWSRDKL